MTGLLASGAATVSERVLAQLDELVPQLGEAYRREIAEYALMDDVTLQRDVLPVTRRLVTTFLTCLVEDRAPSETELAAFEQSGRERLHMGMPLESVLHAYRLCGSRAWSALCAAVEPGEEHLLAQLGARWMDVVDRSASALARAYLAASHERLRDLDSRRRELVEALLTADDPAEVAAVSLRFSTALAPAYTPVLVAGSVAGIDALLAAAPRGTLGGHRTAGGADRVLLLVPGRLPSPLRRTGALLAWGRPAACGRELLDEVRSVEALLLTALAEGHREGAFGPDDLLVEQLLLGNERVADALRRRVVGVLADRDAAGVLVPTLRAYLDTGSVPVTAQREHVHPNTVSYRLNRVRELTGLDARVPRDAALLVLGLGLPEVTST